MSGGPLLGQARFKGLHSGLEQRAHAPWFLHKLWSTIRVDGGVVPGWDSLGRSIPVWRNVGVRALEDHQCFTRATRKGLPVGVGASHVAHKRAARTPLGVEQKRHVRREELAVVELRDQGS